MRCAARAASKAPLNRRRLLSAAETIIDKAAFTRADLVELIGAQLPWTLTAARDRWWSPPSTHSARA